MSKEKELTIWEYLKKNTIDWKLLHVLGIKPEELTQSVTDEFIAEIQKLLLLNWLSNTSISSK